MEAVFDKTKELDKTYTGTILAPFLGLATGVISYGSHWWTIGLSLLFPVLLFRSESRLQAFLIASFYHMGATRSLALAAGRFYGDEVFFGVAIWALGNLVNGLIYGLVWHRLAHVRLLTIPLGVLLTAVPPFGILGWANPLTAAGIIFPGTGLIGFVYLLALYVGLASNNKPILKGIFLLSVWCFFTAKPPKDLGWHAHNTRFGKTDDQGQGDYQRQRHLISLANRSSGKVVVFPESQVTGGWTEISQRLWDNGLNGKKRVMVGADRFEFSESDAARKFNSLVLYDGPGKATGFYDQRQPIPFSMWRPFSKTGYQAQWFTNPTLSVDGQTIAPLICYEGFLVWPVVHSYIAGASRIVAVGNYWWTFGDSIPVIHKSIMTAWSRLFSIPLTMAVNT